MQSLNHATQPENDEMSRSEHNANAWLAQAAEIKRAREERAKLLALGAARKRRETEQRMPARRLGIWS